MFLASLYLRRLRLIDGKIIDGKPNTAIVVFASEESASKLLASFSQPKVESIWGTASIRAQSLDKGGTIAKLFSEKIVRKLRSRAKSTGQSSDSNHPPGPTSGQSKRSIDGDQMPPAKRHKTEGRENPLNGAIATSSHTVSPTPESPQWMRARITQLEAELDHSKAMCDMATSEQDVLRIGREAEQRARREAMTQKSAAEAALSRKTVEHDRLCAELDSALAQNSALSNDASMLRGQLAEVEDRLKLGQSSSDELARSRERIKSLEGQLEEIQDQAYKLQLYKSRIEEQEETKPDTAEFDDMKAKVKQLKSEVRQLRSNLASREEQLESTQRSFESIERKLSSARRKHQRTKDKLAIYKSRRENEGSLVEKLRETLTPGAYRSLGATHETLGALLSAIGLPPVSDDGNTGPKEELE